MYWINGIVQNHLPLSDRVIHFGDGFFTTTPFSNGNIPLLEWHIERLELAAKKLAFPLLDINSLINEMLIVADNGYGVMKVLISRGDCNVGYSSRYCGFPRRIIYKTSEPEHYPQWRENGVNLGISPIFLSRNPLLAGIKHNNRLEQVLIRSYLDQNKLDEALVLDMNGIVIECCSANVFWRYGKDVFTPSLFYSGVSGVMRRLIISLLPNLNYTINVVHAYIDEILLADEVFITNSILPIVSVRSINNQKYLDKSLYIQLSPFCKVF